MAMQPDQRVASVIRRVRLTICILSLHCFDQKAYALAEIAGANGTIAAANVSAAIPARVFERMSAMIFLRRLCGR